MQFAARDFMLDIMVQRMLTSIRVSIKRRLQRGR